MYRVAVEFGAGGTHGSQRTRGRQCGGSLSRVACRARRRISVRQCRDRFRAAGRGVREGRADRHAGAAARARDTREPRLLDGAWLRDGDAPRAGGHGACQRRYCERRLRRAQCGARECTDLVHRRPLAIDRERSSRSPRRLYPLGAGDVRSGRHAARDRQMGLRIAQRRAARNGDRPRPFHRDYLAGRAGLFVIAARSPGGAAAGLFLR